MLINLTCETLYLYDSLLSVLQFKIHSFPLARSCISLLRIFFTLLLFLCCAYFGCYSFAFLGGSKTTCNVFMFCHSVLIYWDRSHERTW